MKLKPEYKITVLFFGFFFAWIGLWIMLGIFYASYLGDTTNRDLRFLALMIFLSISSLCLAVGFTTEKR